MSDASQDPLQSLREDVSEFGWQAVIVQAEGNESDHAHTVGLFATHEHPEIVVFGLDTDLAQELIVAIVERIEEGASFSAGEVCDDILENYRCAFRAVAASHHPRYLDLACRYYGAASFPVLQLFWPDKHGRFPWDPGVRSGYRDLQPQLDSPDV